MNTTLQIACPTLLIRGDDDHLYSLNEAVEQRHSIEKSGLLNIPAAGHVAFQEQESMCVLAIRKIIARRSH